ncbi:patatin-like phospholipase family protein [Achromobacter mucicolens]|uniref:patatin-like phospholipase family protein n=1 Tax=Achromobacter mucicolens TaxID=1389922 RepID=UPI000AF32346|nr:patatin-like phospholipase family protein [Achromobacter mucicolens]
MTQHSTEPAPPPSIDAQCRLRREAYPDSVAFDTSRWGIALSGGGIRSATFCFGLIKALAKQDIFRRFDLMSTVSGGGYIGSTIGKLFQADGASAFSVQQALADADRRQYGAWLRVNGRYLIPGGFKDVLFAAANFGRNLLGIHVEIAILSIILGAILVGLDIMVWQWADCVFQSHGCGSPDWAQRTALEYIAGPPTVWLLFPLIAWIGIALACAYWAFPTQAGERWAFQMTATGVIAVLVMTLIIAHSPFAPSGVWRFPNSFELSRPFVVVTVGVLLAWLTGICIATLLRRTGEDSARIRNRLTKGLSFALGSALVVFALGAADYLAWSIGHFDSESLHTMGAVLAVTAVALRVALPKIADLPKSLSPVSRHGVLALLNLLGMVVIVLVVIFWMGWVHTVISDVLFVQRAPFDLQFGKAYQAIIWLLIPALALVAVSAGNRDFLNRSSLFFFYRARLIRSYLGAANPSRYHGEGNRSSPFSNRRADTSTTARIGDVHSGDDVEMSQYAPHAHGGPIHLINVCINQTRDPNGGLFNRDRKGLLLTIGPHGQMSVASSPWRYPIEDARLTLGSWIAISGAAVAPGLGASTRMGISALLMLAGVRLGYWWDSHGVLGKPDGKCRRRKNKYGQFFSELGGRFDGTARRDWFLSDGGHFENTGAYALLREQCSVIVVADCGADPRYSFGDLENLVRKARIDLQAEITFLRPKSDKEISASSRSNIAALSPGIADFGSLNELASPDSHACLALARVEYIPSGKVGYMVIVKPNMCHGASVDLVNFKADNPLFPQEPTTDQFFSETQWESYFQLGQSLGGKIRLTQVRDLALFAQQNFADDDGAVLETDKDGSRILKPSPKRLSSRIAATGAVSASLSLGGIASLGLAGWEIVNKALESAPKSSGIEPAAYKELTDIFGKMSSAKAAPQEASTSVAEMATALLRIGDLICTDKNQQPFRQSPVAWLMISQTKKACAELANAHASCTVLLDKLTVPNCLQDRPEASCVPTYWIRSYRDVSAPPNCWSPPSIRLAEPRVVITRALARGSEENTTFVATGASVGHVAIQTESKSKPAACAGKTIYVQIYGPAEREFALILRPSWQASGAAVPKIEDVWDSARRAGHRPATPYPVPTVIYHSESAKSCAASLPPAGSSPAWDLRLLPAHFTARPDVIEVWLPPYLQREPPLPSTTFCYQRDSADSGPARYSVHCHPSLQTCNDARESSGLAVQTECASTDAKFAGNVPFDRGWSRSWFSTRATPFGKPFPQIVPSAIEPANSSRHPSN